MDFSNSSNKMDSPNSLEIPNSLDIHITTLVQLLPSNFLQIALTLLLIRLLYKKFNKGLWKIPGPFLAGFTRLYRLSYVLTGQGHLAEVALHRKYGPVVRIGPNHVSVMDAEAQKEIYSVNTRFTKTPFYEVTFPVVDGHSYERSVFATPDHSVHGMIRRLVGHTFSAQTIVSMEPLVDEVIQDFMTALDKFASEGKPVDFGIWAQYFAFDVIGNLTFSRQLGFINEGRDVDGAIGLIQGFARYLSVVSILPELHFFGIGNPIFLKIMHMFGAGNFSPVANFTKRVMKPREHEKPGEYLDMLNRFKTVQEKNPEKVSKEDAFQLAAGNMFAGSDTTGIAIRACVIQLLKHPRCEQKLYEEIERMEEAGRLEKVVTYRETHEMPYLQAVMKEAMRLHPSTGFVLERFVPEGGMEICGHHIPGGTVVGVNPWVAHYNEKVWGEDAGEFRPERWIEAEPEQLRVMERNMLSFGAGARVCLGKHISIMEILKLMATLYRKYHLSLADENNPISSQNHMFVRQFGLVVNIQARDIPKPG